ncbi:MAG TPA: hypothetical protein VME45_07320 [Stellaceae bacterium]|nr:hypothetical protein [Stellaceae bacterium]
MPANRGRRNPPAAVAHSRARLWLYRVLAAGLAAIALSGAFLLAGERDVTFVSGRKGGPGNSGVAVEKTDAPLWLYAALASGLAAFVIMSAVALRFIYPSSVSGPSDAPRGQSAKPALQINAPADLVAHRAVEQQQLRSYGWVDRQAGVVRIPIDRAMRDVAASGIRDWPEDAK